jgi:hypothetical protein
VSFIIFIFLRRRCRQQHPTITTTATIQFKTYIRPIERTNCPGGPFHPLCIVIIEPSTTYNSVVMIPTVFPIKSLIPIVIF